LLLSEPLTFPLMALRPSIVEKEDAVGIDDMKLLRLLALVAALAPLQTNAQTKPVEIGDWNVGQEGEHRCRMLGSFGDNVISFAADPAGNGNLAFFSGGPRFAKASYAASYSFDGWKTEKAATMLPLTLREGSKLNRVLATGIRSDFFVSLSRAKHLWLRIPDIGFDDNLDIPDMPMVFRAFANCIRAIDTTPG